MSGGASGGCGEERRYRPQTLGLLALTALGVWLIGSVVLRWGGAFFALSPLLLAANGTGSWSYLLPGAVGVLAWLAGHWLYAVKHHVYAGPLARRVFLQLLPRRLDPTRHWSLRTTQQ